MPPKGSTARGHSGLREPQARSLAPPRHGAGRCGLGCHPPSAHSSRGRTHRGPLAAACRAARRWLRAGAAGTAGSRRGRFAGCVLQEGAESSYFLPKCQLPARPGSAVLRLLPSTTCTAQPGAQGWQPPPSSPPAAGVGPDLCVGLGPLGRHPLGEALRMDVGGFGLTCTPRLRTASGAEPPALACPELPTEHPLCWDQLCSLLLRPRAVSSFRLRGGGSGGFRRAPSRSSAL